MTILTKDECNQIRRTRMDAGWLEPTSWVVVSECNQIRHIHMDAGDLLDTIDAMRAALEAWVKWDDTIDYDRRTGGGNYQEALYSRARQLTRWAGLNVEGQP